MNDFTTGPIRSHILRTAGPIAAGMIFQTLYYLVDLYFVGKLGDAAVAGVSSAGIIMYIIMALTQVLGVGTAALISHAVGEKNPSKAKLVFNQSLLIALLFALITFAAGYGFANIYMQSIGANAATVQAGLDYLHWYIPGLAMQFALITMGSALRGSGVVKPTMIVQAISVLINTILAPILIAGWGTGNPMGVAGAGLASSIAVAIGVLMMSYYFYKTSSEKQRFVALDKALLKPHKPTWKGIFKIGLPAGGEFAMMFIIMGVIYWVIAGFGAPAQAGFGIGQRIMQAIFLPGMAIAFAASAVAGQNFGANHRKRVRETFNSAASMNLGVMFLLTLSCQFTPELYVKIFTSEAPVIKVGTEFLQIISWNFMAVGIVFTCSSLFQAMGNTVPSLISSASRIITFALPCIWLANRGNFQLETIWYLSASTVTLQAIFSFWLVRREFKKRLADN